MLPKTKPRTGGNEARISTAVGALTGAAVPPSVCTSSGIERSPVQYRARVVDGGVTATGVLSRERGNLYLITVCITLY